MVKSFVSHANFNADEKVSFEEILNFSDFELIESSIPVIAGNLYSPSLAYLVGANRYPRERRQKIAVVAWLKALNNLLDEETFNTIPDSLCITQVDQSVKQ